MIQTSHAGSMGLVYLPIFKVEFHGIFIRINVGKFTRHGSYAHELLLSLVFQSYLLWGWVFWAGFLGSNYLKSKLVWKPKVSCCTFHGPSTNSDVLWFYFCLEKLQDLHLDPYCGPGTFYHCRLTILTSNLGQNWPKFSQNPRLIATENTSFGPPLNGGEKQGKSPAISGKSRLVKL